MVWEWGHESLSYKVAEELTYLVCLVVTELEEVNEKGEYLSWTLVVYVPDAGYAQGEGLQGQKKQEMLSWEREGEGGEKNISPTTFLTNRYSGP